MVWVSVFNGTLNRNEFTTSFALTQSNNRWVALFSGYGATQCRKYGDFYEYENVTLPVVGAIAACISNEGVWVNRHDFQTGAVTANRSVRFRLDDQMPNGTAVQIFRGP